MACSTGRYPCPRHLDSPQQTGFLQVRLILDIFAVVLNKVDTQVSVCTSSFLGRHGDQFLGFFQLKSSLFVRVPAEWPSQPGNSRININSTHSIDYTNQCHLITLHSSNWLFNFAIAYATPPLFAALSAGYYFVIVGFVTISFFVVLFVYPETAHHTLEELAEVFGDTKTLKMSFIEREVAADEREEGAWPQGYS